MKFFKFLFSKVFVLNLFIALILTIAGLFILDSYLDNLTRHGEKVAVPNVINKKIKDLNASLVSKGFPYEIMDSVWEKNLPKGIIFKQKPAPGDSVKEGRKIYLTITARTDEMIKLSIRSIVNGTSAPREAIEYLSSIDLEHGKTIFEPHEWNNIVLGFQDENGNKLKDGDKLKAGSKVTLVVGQVNAEKVRTPKVMGLQLKEAVSILKRKLLNVSITENGDRACIEGIDSSVARITMQRPACGEEINIGKEVLLFYSCDTTLKINNKCR